MRVEGVDRGVERFHRLERVGLELDEPVPQPAEVAELRRGHRRECHLVLQRRRLRRVLGQAFERAQLGVRKTPEQIDHGYPVGGVGER